MDPGSALAAANDVLLSHRNSPSALAACAKELGQIDLVSVVGHEQPYLKDCAPLRKGDASGIIS